MSVGKISGVGLELSQTLGSAIPRVSFGKLRRLTLPLSSGESTAVGTLFFTSSPSSSCLQAHGSVLEVLNYLRVSGGSYYDELLPQISKFLEDPNFLSNNVSQLGFLLCSLACNGIHPFSSLSGLVEMVLSGSDEQQKDSLCRSICRCECDLGEAELAWLCDFLVAQFGNLTGDVEIKAVVGLLVKLSAMPGFGKAQAQAVGGAIYSALLQGTAITIWAPDSLVVCVRCSELLGDCAYSEKVVSFMVDLVANTPFSVEKDAVDKVFLTACDGVAKLISAKTCDAVLKRLVDKVLFDTFCEQANARDIFRDALLVLAGSLFGKMNHDGMMRSAEALRQRLVELYSQEEQEEGENEQEKKLRMAIAVLGTVAKASEENIKARRLVVKTMLERLTEPFGKYDELLIDELVGIVAASEQEKRSFSEVSDMLVTAYRRILNVSGEENSVIYRVVPKSLMTLAVNVQDPALQKELLVSILKLFQSLSHLMFRMPKFTGVLGFCSALLPALGQITSKAAPILQTNELDDETQIDEKDNIRKLMRTVWFYCVFFGFTVKEVWLKEWNKGLKLFASHSPVLVDGRETSIMQIDIELQRLFEGNAHSNLVEDYRFQLSTYAPSLESEISRFSFPQCVFLLSLYYMENSKVQNPDWSVEKTLFLYLNVPSLMTSPVGPCVAALADVVFRKHLKTLHKRPEPRSPGRFHVSRAIVDAVELLVGFSHKEAPVRKASDRYIVMLVSEFPEILWSSCLSTLLSLLEILKHATVVGRDTLVSYVELDGHTLILPDHITGSGGREEMLSNISKLANTWLDTAFAKGPDQLLHALGRYIASFDGKVQQDHMGYSLAVSFVLAKEEKVIRNQVGLDSRNSLFFVSHVVNKFKYSAMVDGIISGMQNLEEASSLIRDKLEGGEADEDFLYMLAAFVIHRQKRLVEQEKEFECGAAELVSLANACFLDWSAEWMSKCIYCWMWVLAETPSLVDVFFLEIENAWNRSMRENHGLFDSVARNPPSPTEAPYGSLKHRGELHANVSAFHEDTSKVHDLWMSFLLQQLVAAEKFSVRLQSIVRMATVGVSKVDHFCPFDTSLCARLRLVYLGLSVLRLDKKNQLLRKRLYDSALNWFSRPPFTYSRESDWEQVVGLTTDIMKLFNKDFASVVKTEKRAGGEQPRTTKGAIGNIYNTQRLRASRTKFRHTDPELGVAIAPLKHLLELLMSHQVLSVGVFYRPLDLPPDIKLDNRGISWEQYAKWAWEAAPGVAVYLTHRFSETRPYVTSLVQAHPEMAMHIGDAVTLFATPEYISNDHPSLRYLMYWSDDLNPNFAIDFLLPQYRHPAVIHYTFRVLRKQTTDTIVFFIPQIVQGMRYDAEGKEEVQSFLEEEAAKSSVTAHQLIWNLRSYIPDEEGEEANALTAKAQHLVEKVIGNFGVQEKRFFEQEFHFMDQVTSISGLLKGVDDKNEKRKILKENLGQIQMMREAEYYLPVNPALTILGIVAEKGEPMQSAEKTPILVPFVVRNENSFERPMRLESEVEVRKSRKEKQDFGKGKEEEQVKEDALTEKDLLVSGEEEEMTVSACIFKVGDDVRQDVLVIQLIQLFKSMFESVDLPLYLYPYRVIATGPECGIIEVVPHATSRDSLGKQIDGSLAEYFAKKWFVAEDFQRAQRKFLESVAAYSLMSYVLQMKDRHNGNILVDEEGHLIHIDFGFVFDISPGGDFKFERAPFKITYEMTQLMGEADPNSDQMKFFKSAIVKGYLVARRYLPAILTLVSLMLETKLSCFKPTTLASLSSRFVPEKNDREAAKFILRKVDEAFGGFSRFTTNVYDVFQKITQGIEH